MAFTTRDFSVLAYADGFALWHYKSGTDSLDDVARNDYFGDASDMMAVGDMVLVSSKSAGTIMFVVSNTLNTVRTTVLR